MEWIAVFLLLLLIVFGAISRKETVPKECNASTVTKPFYRMAVYILRRLEKEAEGGSLHGKLRKAIFRKNEENIRLLDPAGDVKQKLYLHFIQKTAICLLLLTAGVLLSFVISYSESQEKLLQEGNVLLRREYGKGHYEVELMAWAEQGENGEETLSEPVEVAVLQRSFTEEELREMLPAFETDLEKAVLAENESTDHVDRDLKLVDGLDGYPFSVEWEYSDHSLIDHQGRLKEELPAEGTLLNLEARIRCDTLEALHGFSVMVWPREVSGEEQLKEKILEALQLSDESTRTSEQFLLPSEVDGVQIRWSEEKKSSFLILLLLVVGASAAVYWGKDNDLEKQVKERDMQMTGDYPEMISKLSLYVGAGMTIRLAWKKMALEYIKKQKTRQEEQELEEKRKKTSVSGKKNNTKRFVYEEMVLTMREMESGVSELQAYRHFAKRCRLQKYVKLVSLLEQNVRLGAGGFLESLQKETGEALEERRSMSKTLGEEAGTKLLVPMILMLAIVMVVIIVPAFLSI